MMSFAVTSDHCLVSRYHNEWRVARVAQVDVKSGDVWSFKDTVQASYALQ